MLKKNHVLIADSIIEWHNNTEGLSYDIFTRFIDIVSRNLENDNDKFDKGNFTRYIIERVQ